MDEKNDVDVKVFNSAKLMIEKAIFPLQLDYKKFQRQTNYGTDILEESINMTEEIRDISRFNACKALAETCRDLLKSISSTVKLKKNKEENSKLEELIETIEKVILLFYKHKERFFNSEYKNMKLVDVLDRDYFDKIRKIIDVCYINTEMLMTRNKLMFSDAGNEFKSDEEIKEDILKRYVEG